MVPICNTHVAESRLNATLIIATETERQQNEMTQAGRFQGESQPFFAAISQSGGRKC